VFWVSHIPGSWLALLCLDLATPYPHAPLQVTPRPTQRLSRRNPLVRIPADIVHLTTSDQTSGAFLIPTNPTSFRVCRQPYPGTTELGSRRRRRSCAQHSPLQTPGSLGTQLVRGRGSVRSHSCPGCESNFALSLALYLSSIFHVSPSVRPTTAPLHLVRSVHSFQSLGHQTHSHSLTQNTCILNPRHVISRPVSDD